MLKKAQENIKLENKKTKLGVTIEDVQVEIKLGVKDLREKLEYL